MVDSEHLFAKRARASTARKSRASAKTRKGWPVQNIFANRPLTESQVQVSSNNLLTIS
jgi:hypothetical protein